MKDQIKNEKKGILKLNEKQKNSNLQEKLDKLNKIKPIYNKIENKKSFNSSILKNHSKTKVKFNFKNIDENIFKDDKLFLSGIQNKNNLTNYKKKNLLTPINKSYLSKNNSMYNLIQKKNNKDIFSSIQSLNLSRNKKLKKIKTFNSFTNLKKNINNLSMNNFTGFNSQKNSSTNYIFSKNNSKLFMSSYDSNNFSQTKKKGNFSKFFYKSQSKLYTSKRIFRHYIKEEERDKVVPIKYFKRGGAPKSMKELKELNKNNIQFEKRIKEIKSNSNIAFKDDFNILEYQTTLIKLLSNRISEKNLHELQKNFVIFNEKNFGLTGPKGRFTNMAEKIKYNIPLYLYEKIKQLDTDKLISRYNYYKRINENIKKKFKKKYDKKGNKKNKNTSLSKVGNFQGLNYSY